MPEKATVICSTLLIESSPQSIPLGAACIASSIKADLFLSEKLITFCDKDLSNCSNDYTLV